VLDGNFHRRLISSRSDGSIKMVNHCHGEGNNAYQNRRVVILVTKRY